MSGKGSSVEIPVYLITGFLDAGKTSFINGALEDGFTRSERTLLLRCEEGEEEYEHGALDNVTVVDVGSEADLNRAFLEQCQSKYHPQQVMIEYNGMWSLERLYREVLPENWILYQIMTLVEAATFEVYVKNMGQLMMEKITNADLLIFNRCTPQLREALRARNLRMVNRQASIYLENEDGTSEDYLTGDECPFDLSQDPVEIPDDDFGFFYVDVMDHPERYAGKTIHAKLVMARSQRYGGVPCPGRFAMVCCADDVTFLGLLARGEALLAPFHDRDWMEVTARMGVEEHPAYQGKGPVMELLTVRPCSPARQEVVSF